MNAYASTRNAEWFDEYEYYVKHILGPCSHKLSTAMRHFGLTFDSSPPLS